MRNENWKWAVAGALAGLTNGLFGGGGGMILVPLLLRWIRTEEKTAFASSVAIILPVCMVSAWVYWYQGLLVVHRALPYMLGGLAGGFLGGKLFKQASPVLLRKVFALFLLYGGVKCLLGSG